MMNAACMETVSETGFNTPNPSPASPSLCNFTLIVPETDLSYIPKARYYISRSRILSPSLTPQTQPTLAPHLIRPPTATCQLMGVVHLVLKRNTLWGNNFRAWPINSRGRGTKCKLVVYSGWPPSTSNMRRIWSWMWTLTRSDYERWASTAAILNNWGVRSQSRWMPTGKKKIINMSDPLSKGATSCL